MSLFEKNLNPPKIKLGHPCLMCPHTHLEHGAYAPQICHIDGCPCRGLKLDVKPIA